MTNVLRRERQRRLDTQRRGGFVITEAEIGVMWSLVKGCWQPADALDKTGGTLPSSLQREPGPADTCISDFYPPEL